MTMNIKLRFFGQLKDLTKVSEQGITIKEDTTVEDLVWIIGERFPNLREHLKTVSFAVNNEYAPRDTILKTADEVGILPPISGGSR